MVLKKCLGKFQDFACPFRLLVRTLSFQDMNVGSIPIKGNLSKLILSLFSSMVRTIAL